MLLWEVLDAASVGAGAAAGVRGLQAFQSATTVGVEFGANANQTYHAFRHIDAIGMSRDAAVKAIKSDIPTLKIGQGVTRTVKIDGIDLTYRVHRLTQSKINVGRITPP